MSERLDREGFLARLARELDEPDDLVQVVATARASRGAPPRRLVLRFFGEKGARRASATRFAGKRQVSQETIAPGDLAPRLAELLVDPFEAWSLERSSRDLHARRTKKGAYLASEGRRAPREVPVAHDRARERSLDPGDAATVRVLHAVGLASAEGRVLPGREKKYRQVCQFVKLASEAAAKVESPPSAPLAILDAGCGAAYLTLALAHALGRERPVLVLGVDVREDVLERARRAAAEAGLSGVARFERRAIRDVREPSDLVLSLHACDTATDEAMACGVALGARAVLSAPCCQHELHGKVRSDALEPLLRHGILRERLADLATDALRAQALRARGYSVDVVELVDPEATAKNVLIRATRARGAPTRDEAALAGLDAMKRSLGLDGPLAIEGLLLTMAGEGTEPR